MGAHSVEEREAARWAWQALREFEETAALHAAALAAARLDFALCAEEPWEGATALPKAAGAGERAWKQSRWAAGLRRRALRRRVS